jgi:hypothetical protein
MVDMTRRAWVLERGGKTLTARVVDLMGDKPGRRPKVQYQFEVEGDPKTYQHYDLFFSRAHGAHVSTQQWHAARRDRFIGVTYWPGDPRVNAPTGGPPINNSIVCPAMGFCFAASVAALGWVLVVRSLRPRRPHAME